MLRRGGFSSLWQDRQGVRSLRKMKKCPNLIKLSLFSGILGDDLASEWAGIKTVCCVEIDPFCQVVIRKHYPNMPIIGDIHDVTKAKLKEVSGYEWVDIISGGDPCQPRSIAGKRRGREDDRDLWPIMLRIIQEFHPTWVVNENPTGRLTMDFYEVLFDLESQGYETRSFIIPASAVNACHGRERIYIVAHTNGTRKLQLQRGIKDIRERVYDNPRKNNPHTVSYRLEGKLRQGSSSEKGWTPETFSPSEISEWQKVYFPESPICGVGDGLPFSLDGLKLSVRQHRNKRIETLGNAQVPQQIYPIYKAIMRVEGVTGGTVK